MASINLSPTRSRYVDYSSANRTFMQLYSTP